MKARFSQPQPPVNVIRSEGKIYVFICLNEKQGTETYQDMGEGQTEESYYKYDYNEISGPEDEIPVEDIQEHPDNYLEYAYSPAASDPGTQALAEVKELKAAIERGLAT